jgi:hypothetical protein
VNPDMLALALLAGLLDPSENQPTQRSTLQTKPPCRILTVMMQVHWMLLGSDTASQSYNQVRLVISYHPYINKQITWPLTLVVFKLLRTP